MFIASKENQQLVAYRDAETLAALSAVMTVYCLLMNFVLQKLGNVMSERELAKLKEATLLKQVSLPFVILHNPTCHWFEASLMG